MAKRKNTKAASEVLINDMDRNIIRRPHSAKESIAQEVAEDKFHYVNYYVPELKKMYPQHPKLWHVDKYFPNAKCGRLFVDEPQFEYQHEECAQKKTVMKEFRLKYAVLTKDTDIDLLRYELEAT